MLANVFDRVRTLALAFVLIVIALPAFAGPFEDAVGKFANDDFSDTEEAIGVVAACAVPVPKRRMAGAASADARTWRRVNMEFSPLRRFLIGYPGVRR